MLNKIILVYFQKQLVLLPHLISSKPSREQTGDKLGYDFNNMKFTYKIIIIVINFIVLNRVKNVVINIFVKHDLGLKPTPV